MLLALPRTFVVGRCQWTFLLLLRLASIDLFIELICFSCGQNTDRKYKNIWINNWSSGEHERESAHRLTEEYGNRYVYFTFSPFLLFSFVEVCSSFCSLGYILSHFGWWANGKYGEITLLNRLNEHFFYSSIATLLKKDFNIDGSKPKTFFFWWFFLSHPLISIVFTFCSFITPI